MISMAATGILNVEVRSQQCLIRSSYRNVAYPARITLDAAAAASRIVGKVTTATLVSCGITVNLRVISVTNPSVPSEPMKRFVRL
jgi:hypothetical protein